MSLERKVKRNKLKKYMEQHKMIDKEGNKVKLKQLWKSYNQKSKIN